MLEPLALLGRSLPQLPMTGWIIDAPPFLDAEPEAAPNVSANSAAPVVQEIEPASRKRKEPDAPSSAVPLAAPAAAAAAAAAPVPVVLPATTAVVANTRQPAQATAAVASGADAYLHRLLHARALTSGYFAGPSAALVPVDEPLGSGV